MHFEPVQHQCAEAVRLELGCNSEEDDFDEALGWERPEHAPTDDLNLAVLVALVVGNRLGQSILELRPALPDEDGLVLPVHSQAYNIVPRHAR